MLRKKHRLPVKRVIFKKSLSTPLFTIRMAQTNNTESRFGFIVSKQVDKKAVGRNAIKRKFAHSVQTLLPFIRPGYDVLFIVKSGARDKEYTRIEESIRKVLQESTIIKE